MTRYYRRRDHARDFYAIYVQESDHWRIDDGVHEPVKTAGTIPDSVMSTLQEGSSEDALRQWDKNRLRLTLPDPPSLTSGRRRVPALLGASALLAVMIALGIYAVFCLHSFASRGWNGSPLAMLLGLCLFGPFLLLLAIAVVVVCKRLVTLRSAVASAPAGAGRVDKPHQVARAEADSSRALAPADEPADSPHVQEAASQARKPGRWRAVAGYLLGWIVGVASFPVLASTPIAGNLVGSWVLLFLLGLVAAGIGLAASRPPGEWHQVKSEKLVLRLVVRAIICGAAIYVGWLLVVAVQEHIGFVRVIR
jgi:hypothetical protein